MIPSNQNTLSRAGLLLWFVLFLGPARAQFATSNLLVNPGAETGDLTGWTRGGNSNPFAGNPGNSLGDGFATHSGGYYFVGGTGAAYGSLTQTVGISGIQGITPAMI